MTRRIGATAFALALLAGNLVVTEVAVAVEPPRDSQVAEESEGVWVTAAARRGALFGLYSFRIDTQGEQPIITHHTPLLEPAWAPGGKKIAYVSFIDGVGQLWVYDVESKSSSNLTRTTSYERSPAWSPDGTKIAFTSNRDSNQEIYVMNADSSGVVNLTNHKGYDADPVWSPDGTKIAFASMRDRTPFRLFVMNADGSEQQPLSERPLRGWLYPAWSPDGKWIAVGDRGNDNSVTLLLLNVEDKSFKEIAATEKGCNSYASWSPDGRYMAYAHFDNMPSAYTGGQIDANEVGGDLMLYDVEKGQRTTIAKGVLPTWGPRATWVPAAKEKE